MGQDLPYRLRLWDVHFVLLLWERRSRLVTSYGQGDESYALLYWVTGVERYHSNLGMDRGSSVHRVYTHVYKPQDDIRMV